MFHHFKGIRILKQLLAKGGVQGVPRFMHHQATVDGHAHQSQITNRVEKFVSNELIGVPKTFVIQDAEPIEHHGVFQGSAQAQTCLLHGVDVFFETEGSSASNFPSKTLRRHVNGLRLVFNQGMLEVDGAANVKTGRSVQGSNLATLSPSRTSTSFLITSFLVVSFW